MTFDTDRPAQPAQPDQPVPFAPATTEPSAAPSQASPTTSKSTPPRRKGSSTLVNVGLAIAIAVAIGGVAFAVGRSTAPTSASGFPGRPGAGLENGAGFPTGSGAPGFGAGGFPRGGRTITGTVAAIDADTLTITTESGQTMELTLGSDTTYSTKAPGSSSDVTTGATVEIQLDFGAGGGALGGGAAASGPTGTASSVTVVP